MVRRNGHASAPLPKAAARLSASPKARLIPQQPLARLPRSFSRIGEFARMQQDPKRRAGIGVMVGLAGATFAVAVISGVFLFYDSQPTLRAGFPLDFPAPQSSTETARAIPPHTDQDRKSTRLNSSHVKISYAVFCLIKQR